MRRTLLLTLAIGLAAAAFAWRQEAVRQFQHEGKTVSTNLRVVDGTLMVSAKDVASYLGGTLSVENGTATVVMKKANDGSGGTPYRLLSGGSQPFSPTEKRPDPREISVKIGGDADNDGFVLRVAAVEEPKKSYRTELDTRGRRIDTHVPNDRLVVVRMRLENRTAETRRPPIPSSLDLTLFDDANVGFPVVAFDARPVGNTDLVPDLAPYDNLDAPILAPKGAFEFNAVFSLPKDRTPSRLTISLPPSSTDKGGANVAVDLRS